MTSAHHHKLARSAGVFTGATMISRILGYARDSMMAHFFGAGVAADAFYAAFRISNLFRRLLGEGALSASFIPIFTRYHETQGHEKTQEFLNVMWTMLLILLLVIVLLGIVFAPQITRLIAMGFKKTPARFALTVTLTRWMFPFLLFISMAALLTGVINSFHSFFLPALAPACLSLAEIAYLLMLAPWMPLERQIIGLAAAVSVGGFCQFFLHVPALHEKGFKLGFKWNLAHPGLRSVGKLMIPATLGISVDQLNAFVDTICASFLVEGSITALYYANRVMQLPLALFGIALSQVSLPAMSASVARGQTQDVKDTLNFALRLTLFMIVPATTGLLLLGQPIIQALFQHGEFSTAATLLTNRALFFFSFGLFAYAAVKILAGAFYAHQNTRVPVMIAGLCVAINITMNLLLMKRMGVAGLALSTATASWVNAGALYAMLRRKLGHLGGRRIFLTFLKALLASAAMGAFCRFTMSSMNFHGRRIPLFLMLTIAIAGGAAVYLACAKLLCMEEWDPFWAQLARRKNRAVS